MSGCRWDTHVRILTRLIVGLGPGPFTGLRVGVVTAQVLGQVLGLELRGVCSLDVVAAQFVAAHSAEFVVATDARRREVYWARYSPGGVRLGEPRVSRPVDVPRLPDHRTRSRPLRRSTAGGARPTIDGSGVFLRRRGATLPDAGMSRCICGIPMRPS